MMNNPAEPTPRKPKLRDVESLAMEQVAEEIATCKLPVRRRGLIAQYHTLVDAARMRREMEGGE